MEHTWVREKEAPAMPHFLIIWEEEKQALLLFGCLALGIALGSASGAVYGNASRWSGLVEAYCADGVRAACELLWMTVGTIVAVFVLAPLSITRLLIYPTVCFRGMGLGLLVSALLQSAGSKGLCFTALVVLPYAAVNAALAVYAGEYALGVRESFGQGNTGLTKGLLLHMLKMFLLCIGAAALSCAVFGASCMGFGRYLL